MLQGTQEMPCPPARIEIQRAYLKAFLAGMGGIGHEGGGKNALTKYLDKYVIVHTAGVFKKPR